MVLGRCMAGFKTESELIGDATGIPGWSGWSPSLASDCPCATDAIVAEDGYDRPAQPSGGFLERL